MKNKLLKHTGAMLLLLACCLTSCIKEEGFTPTDKASVTLTFTTRAPGDDADPNAVLKGEGMKNLRVIVVDQASKEIRFNRTFPVPDNATSHTVRFGDLYAGRTYDFYAIANEASFGGDFSTYAEGTKLDNEDALLNYPIRVADANALIDAEAGTYLPAAGKAELPVKAEADQKLDITMQRAVAKAKVTFVNETGTEQTITGVKLVKVGASSTTLFPRTTTLPTASENLELGTVSVTAADGSVGSALGYFYESAAPADGYALEATWNGNMKRFALADMEGGTAISSQILRNQMLNITITLKVNDWKLEANVLPWNHEQIDFEYDNTLSYTSMGWIDETILRREDNDIYLRNVEGDEGVAELRFRIESPSLVQWSAELFEEGDGHNFEFVGPSTGLVSIEGDNAPEQVIRVRVTDPESLDTHRATLRVVATLPGSTTYELDLTGSGGSTSGESEANRFTLIQAI